MRSSAVEMFLPIDRGWAWVILAACFGMNVLNAGYIKCYGILFVEFEKSLHTTASTTSILMGVNAATGSITALVVLNIVLERVSVRKTAVVGVLTLSTGVLINAFASDIYTLLFSQGVLAGAGAAMLYGPGLVQVSKYFEKRRALATAICSCGVSVGGMCLPVILQKLVKEYSLRGAFIIMSGLMLQILVCVSLYRPLSFYAKRSKMTGASCEESVALQDQRSESKCLSEYTMDRANDEDALPSSEVAEMTRRGGGGGDTDECNDCEKTNSAIETHSHTSRNISHTFQSCLNSLNLSIFKNPLYILIFGFTSCGFLGVGLFQTFLPPLAKEKGLTEMQAAMLLTLFNGLELISRLIAGFLGEIPYIKRYITIAFSMVLLGTLNQLTRYISSLELMTAYVAVFGILNGIYPALHPAVIIDFVGVEDFSKVFGYVQVFHAAMMTACYPFMGALRDMTGSYTVSFHFLGACKLTSAMFLMLLPLARGRTQKTL